MDVQISADAHTETGEDVLARLTEAVESGLARFEQQLTRVEVHLSDENPGGAGPRDVRCVVEVRPAGMDPLAVSDDAATVEDACAGALRKLRQLLDRRFGRLDSKAGRATIREAGG